MGTGGVIYDTCGYCRLSMGTDGVIHDTWGYMTIEVWVHIVKIPSNTIGDILYW